MEYGNEKNDNEYADDKKMWHEKNVARTVSQKKVMEMRTQKGEARCRHTNSFPFYLSVLTWLVDSSTRVSDMINK